MTLNEIAEILERMVPTIQGAMDEALRDPNLAKVLVLFQRLKDSYEALDEQRKEIYAIVDGFSKGAIPERFQEQGIDKIAVPEIRRSFYPITKFSATMLDKEAGMKWLRSVGAGDLIQETVNAQTLATFVKDLVLNQGKDAPEDVIKFTPYYVTGSSKYTPKGAK